MKKELFQCILATFCVALGVSFYIECQLGADSISVFLDGMNKTFGFSISIVDQIIVMILFIIAYLLNKKHIGISTIVHTLLIGICVVLTSQISSFLQLSQQSFLIRCLGVLLAQIFYGFGFAFMQNFKYGMSTADACMYGLVEKTSLSYIKIHFIFDILFFIGGFLLGGTIGIGSIFYVITSGFITFKVKQIIDLFIKRRTVFN